LSHHAQECRAKNAYFTIFGLNGLGTQFANIRGTMNNLSPNSNNRSAPTRGRTERVMLMAIIALQALIVAKLFLPSSENVADTAGQNGSYFATTPTRVGPAQASMPDWASVPNRQRLSADDCAEAEMQAVMLQLIRICEGGAADPRLARMLDRDIRGTHMMHQSVDRSFASMMRDFQQFDALLNIDEGWPTLAPTPALDMRDLESHYLVMFSLPGMCSEDVKLRLDGRILTLLCEAQDATGPSFERRVMLPGEIDASRETQARLTNGVLKVFLPKMIDTLTTISNGTAIVREPVEREML
jgi:HSP20 family molecular chaperone IbpA